MKYLMLGNDNTLFPIIFPDAIPHVVVSESLCNNKDLEKLNLKPVSAGFLDLDVSVVYGEATSMDHITSRQVDKNVIRGYDRNYGIREMYEPDNKYFPFDGDGRRKVTCTEVPYGTIPISMTRSTARSLIDHFLNAGESHHTKNGNTLWVLITYCRAHLLKYDIRQSDMGITITLRKEQV